MEDREAILWAVLAALLVVAPILWAAAQPPRTVQMTVAEFNRIW